MHCNAVCRCVCMYVFYPHILSTVHSPDKRSARHFFSQSATQPAAQPRAQSITDSTPQAARSEHILPTVHSPDTRSSRHFCFLSQPLSQQLSQAFTQSLNQRLKQRDRGTFSQLFTIQTGGALAIFLFSANHSASSSVKHPVSH